MRQFRVLVRRVWRGEIRLRGLSGATVRRLPVVVPVMVTRNVGRFGLFLVRTGLVSVNDAEVVLVPTQRHGVIAILVSVVARFADVFA